jgi:hypothetical protein
MQCVDENAPTDTGTPKGVQLRYFPLFNMQSRALLFAGRRQSRRPAQCEILRYVERGLSYVSTITIYKDVQNKSLK